MPVGSEENKKNTRRTKPEEPKPAQWIFPSRESAPPAKNLHSNICILMQCKCKCGCVCVLWVRLCLCVCVSVHVCVMFVQAPDPLCHPPLLLLLYFVVALVQTVQTFTCKTKFEKERRRKRSRSEGIERRRSQREKLTIVLSYLGNEFVQSSKLIDLPCI